MAQYDFGTIDPNTKSGTALASDLNSWRNALHSTHSGSAAPSYVTAAMLWADTTSANYELKMYDGAQWIPVAVLDATNNVARVAVDGAETTYISSPAAGQIRHTIANVLTATMRSTGLQFNIASPVISDSNANELVSFTTTASAVNQISIANAATSAPVILSTVGGDTNIDLLLMGKGSGSVRTMIETAVTNNVLNAMQIEARSTGTPAIGFGAGLHYVVETSADNFETGARIDAIITDPTLGSEDFDLSFKVMAGGAAAVEVMRIRSTGIVDMDGLSIGGTTILPTAAELNFVDGVTSAIQTQLNAKAALASPALTGTPTSTTAAVGTNTTQIATTAFVNAEIANDVDVRLGGISANQTITSGGLLTIAHGLGQAPKITQFELVCITADAGWAINDVIIVHVNATSAGNDRINSCYVDATNLYFRFSNAATCFTSGIKTTGAAVSLTNANWRLRIRVFA